MEDSELPVFRHKRLFINISLLKGPHQFSAQSRSIDQVIAPISHSSNLLILSPAGLSECFPDPASTNRPRVGVILRGRISGASDNSTSREENLISMKFVRGLSWQQVGHKRILFDPRLSPSISHLILSPEAHQRHYNKLKKSVTINRKLY